MMVTGVVIGEVNKMSEQQNRKESEIWQACDALVAQGQKVTYKGVGDSLEQLGFCRGSNSDIARYLKTWKQYSDGQLNQPAVVSDPVLKAIASVHQQLQSDAEAEIQAMRVQYADEIEQLREALAGKEALCKEKQEESNQAQEKIQELLKLQQALQNKLQDSRDQLVAVSAKREVEQAYLDEVKNEFSAQKKELIAQFKIKVDELEAVYKEAATQQAKIIEQVKQENTRLIAELNQAVSLQAGAQHWLKKHEGQLDALKNTIQEQVREQQSGKNELQKALVNVDQQQSVLIKGFQQSVVSIKNLCAKVEALEKQVTEKQETQAKKNDLVAN